MRYGVLVIPPKLASLLPMPTALKSPRKRAVSRRRSMSTGLKDFKAVAGSPLAGLEHLIGCVSLPRDSRSRREVLRARALADHHT